MSENRWQANRAGLMNYWYYDEAEFHFSGGRLFLRGANGSGKSVTMQSLVTVLLDGVKRADRLDSFGSQARTMEDYLLGEKELGMDDERTGYLYLEYKREHSDQYITTGIGLHTRRGSGRMEFWGFVLYSSRRIGKDFMLYRFSKDAATGKMNKLPLTRKELENAIGGEGMVTNEQREYMALVNQYIFGYQDIGKYEELIKLLIQLRSPKLSKEFKPSVIYEILNASLSTLSEEDLRPLAETLENMEKTRLAVEQLRREQEAFLYICRAYTEYNVAVLAERALGAAECQKTIRRLENKQERKRVQLQEVEELAAAAYSAQQSLAVEEAALQQEQHDLQEHEAYKAAARKGEVEKLLAAAEQEKKRREESWSEKRHRELELKDQARQEEVELGRLEKEAGDLLDNMGSMADDSDFSAHERFRQGFALINEGAESYFELWRKERQEYLQQLRQLHKELLDYEQLQEKNRQKSMELGEENRRLDQYRHEYDLLLEKAEAARERLVKEFYEWKGKWQEILPLSGEQVLFLSGGLRELYQGADWLDLQEYLGNIISEKQRQIDAGLGGATLRKQKISGRLEYADNELKVLKETGEAEPDLGAGQLKARQILKDCGIPFLTFYEATEFRSHIPQDMRERLESALMESGLLTAIILDKNETAQELPEEMRGTLLQAGEPVMLAESLLDYLEPVPGASGLGKERIVEVLASIAVDGSLYRAGSGLAVNIEQGGYSLGLLTGRAVERESALFIGRQAREACRRQQISAKEQEIAELEKELVLVEDEERQLLEASHQLRLAGQEFPSREEIQQVHDEAHSLANDIKVQEQRFRERQEEQDALVSMLHVAHAGIIRQRGKSSLAFSSVAYEQAQRAMEEYGEEWGRLMCLQSIYAQTQKHYHQHLAEADYMGREVDSLKGELLKKEFEIAKLKKNIEALDRQLEEMDAEAIEKRIVVCLARLSEIRQETRQVERQLLEAEHNRKNLSEALAVLEEHCALYKNILAKWQFLLEAEEKRGFPTQDKTLQELMQKRQEDRENTSLAKLYHILTNLHAKYRDVIAEYRFSFKEVTDDIGLRPECASEDEEIISLRWTALKDNAARYLALAETDGRSRSPYEQLEMLKTQLLELENLLSEQDKELYREIILNNIGRTISDKIYDAEDWIKKMNHLMSQSETSSGIRLRLEWTPVENLNGTDLDTAQMVKLLHMDPKVMKEDDIRTLEEYFSTRIRMAMAEAKFLEKEADAYQVSVREQLDYRRWFGFRLYYDRGEGSKRRELTDRTFCSFSGGEKAIAMYIPLFSAAYSRYMDAGKDAPRLITLDEAFAGVDDKNIREMFRLVEQMGFNYIMNSQAISGDYDVVPSLNIYELLREQNSNCVPMQKYHWDGACLSLVVKEEDL